METVTMIFPKAVTIMTNEHQKIKFEAGTQEVPVEHADNPYLAMNGVKKYDPKAKKQKPAEADERTKAEREAEFKAKELLLIEERKEKERAEDEERLAKKKAAEAAAADKLLEEAAERKRTEAEEEEKRKKAGDKKNKK